MQTKIDSCAYAHIYLCECGARGDAEASRDDALRSARRHELHAHPGDTNVLGAIRQRDKRRSAKSDAEADAALAAEDPTPDRPQHMTVFVDRRPASL